VGIFRSNAGWFSGPKRIFGGGNPLSCGLSGGKRLATGNNDTRLLIPIFGIRDKGGYPEYDKPLCD
jgi:hypothetical protein